MDGTIRWHRLLAGMATLALVAAACGGDGGGGGGAPAEGEQRFQAQDLSGQSIEVMAKWTEGTAEQEPFLAVLDAFSKATGAETTYTPAGDEIPTVLGTRVQGGDPPDVAILPQPGVFRDFAQQGALQPLDEVVGDLVDANFAPVWGELGTVEDTLYGVWFKAAPKHTFWYSVSVFGDAGVEAPATWEELQTVAQTIKDFGLPPYAIDGASGWVLSDWFEAIYLSQSGPEMYDQLANHEIPWTDQSVKDALTTFSDVVGDESNLLGGIDGTLQSEFPAALAQAFGEPPQAGMYYEGDFVGGTAAAEAGAQPGQDIDFFDFPAVGEPQSAIVTAGDVAVMLEDNEAARALLQFLASPEAGEVWAKRGGFTSPNQGVELSTYPDEVTQRIADGLVSAEAVVFDLSDLQPGEFGATAGQGIWGLLQDFVRTPDVDATSQQLEDAAKQAFG